MPKYRPRRARRWYHHRWAPIAVCGGAFVLVGASSVGLELMATNATATVAADPAPTADRTEAIDRWGVRTPLPELPTPVSATATPTPTPSATPSRTPTPSRTTPRPSTTKATTPTTTATRATVRPTPTRAVSTSQPVTSKPSGNCPPLQGGGAARALALHQALCANFPQVKAYGGMRPGDPLFHGSGRAIDAMVYGDFATGQAIANWARANAAQYGITEVIWNKSIWTTQRSSEGWRRMSDRGSVTANHQDHPHLSVR